MSDEFDAFFERRREAASAYVAGDGSQVDAIVPHDGAATFHAPGGDSVTGAEAIAKRYLDDSRSFSPVGESRFEILQKESSGDLAFWTGYQVATVQIGSMPQPVEMRLRVTEVFRRIDGAWRMIHRHADPGAQADR